MIKLFDITSVIRSKNAGPYELTFDIIFNTKEEYDKFVSHNIMTKQVFAKLYNISESSVLSIMAFAASKAIKITIIRPMSSGALGERDVYGAQQHLPLLNFEFLY